MGSNVCFMGELFLCACKFWIPKLLAVSVLELCSRLSFVLFNDLSKDIK